MINWKARRNVEQTSSKKWTRVGKGFQHEIQLQLIDVVNNPNNITNVEQKDKNLPMVDNSAGA
jgi:hypothetical protein